MQEFNQAFFNETFILNHETGDLKWRVAPPRNPRHKQCVAGCKVYDDSVLITIQKKKFLRHRIVYIMVNGDIEENMEIRHKNRVRGDDRPCNLIAVKKGTPIPKNEVKKPVIKPKRLIGSEKFAKIISQSNLITVKKAVKVKQAKPKKVVKRPDPFRSLIEPKQPMIEVESPIIETPAFKGVRCNDCKVSCKNQGYLAKIVLQSGCPDFKQKL